MQEMRLTGRREEDGVFRHVPDPAGRPVRVLVEVDDGAFRAEWLAAVEAASRPLAA